MHHQDHDLSFERDGTTFGFRAAGVALNGGRVLLQRTDVDPFWVLPGGRVQVAESAEDALRREMREELKADVEIEALLWTLENFFVYRSAPNREIGLYFLMNLAPDSELYDADGVVKTRDEMGRQLWHRWQSLDALDELPMKPTFLHDVLPRVHDAPNYIVHRDRR